jgi:hypothetical protein
MRPAFSSNPYVIRDSQALRSLRGASDIGGAMIVWRSFNGLRRAKRSLWLAAVALAGVCALPTTLRAQWINYPTAGIPRTKDGKPNLKAPAPRTREGKPDLSGIWYGEPVLAGESPDLVPLLPPVMFTEALKVAGIPAPAPGGPKDDPCPTHDCISQEDFPSDGVNMGQSLPGKTLPYQPWARQLVVQHMAAAATDDPHAHCLPPSYPRAFALPQHWKIVQTRGLLVLLHEFNASFRQIFLDGRPLPVDPQPGWNGYSTGHWERDTLVVETIGFRNDLWLDIIGSPLTEAAHVTERFERVNFGTLKVQVTVNDPKAYTHPWTITMRARLVPDTELLDDICLENERSNRLLVGGKSP